jgi:hypothetical protein
MPQESYETSGRIRPIPSWFLLRPLASMRAADRHGGLCPQEAAVKDGRRPAKRILEGCAVTGS